MRTITPSSLDRPTMEAQIVGHIVQGFGGYTVLQVGGGRLDVGAGVRGYSLAARLSFEGGTIGSRESSGQGVWGDAVGAVRGRWSFEDGWELAVDADVGAGGSKLSWEVIGAAGFRFGWGTLFGGWRYLAVDHGATSCSTSRSPADSSELGLRSDGPPRYSGAPVEGQPSCRREVHRWW